jgi:hypothetical protein
MSKLRCIMSGWIFLIISWIMMWMSKDEATVAIPSAFALAFFLLGYAAIEKE